jgi:hypothetical protein
LIYIMFCLEIIMKLYLYKVTAEPSGKFKIKYLKRFVSLFLIIFIGIHHIFLLRNIAYDQVDDLINHYRIHVQIQPDLSLLEWINMHFNPLSKHLFSGENHAKSPDIQKNFSLCLFKGSHLNLQQVIWLNSKNKILEPTGKYKFLFIREFLIPPKG